MHTDYSGGRWIKIAHDSFSKDITSDIFLYVIKPTYFRFYHPSIEGSIPIQLTATGCHIALPYGTVSITSTQSSTISAFIITTLVGYLLFIEEDPTDAHVILAEALMVLIGKNPCTFKVPPATDVVSIVSIPFSNIYLGYTFKVQSISGACYLLEDGRYLPWWYVVPYKGAE